MLRMLALLFAVILNTASASPFRVLVFPHLGTYPIPQGREALISSVTVTSEEECHRYRAEMNPQGEWKKTGDLLDTKKEVTLTSLDSNLMETFYFECSKPFKIDRGPAHTAFSYSGDFVAIVDGLGKMVRIINLVEPEKYLQGVVPSEVGSGWPAETLKAQSVAARTFAWWTVLNDRTSGPHYDLNDTIEYQAYLGISSETISTNDAVSATAHQVMKYDGKVIKAYFSADSGGRTESAIDGFNQALPYCVSKAEQYDLLKVKSEWETTRTLEEISSAMGYQITDIEILKTDLTLSGRVSTVTLTLTDQSQIKIKATAFRIALKLRSTFFELKTHVVDGKKYVQIVGKGYGHGVGMAQVGAREYALQLGWSFEQILKFYYTGITLETIAHEYTE